MSGEVRRFEHIARLAYRFSDQKEQEDLALHPFYARGIHDDLASVVRDLFDNGHYAQATFEAMKYLDHIVRRHSGLGESGMSLMMKAFGGDPPPIMLNPNQTRSERDEQEGYKFLFAGAVMGIRNPRGHEYAVVDSPEECLDHLSFASMLLRRLAAAGCT